MKLKRQLRATAQKGFTLIELAVVIAIIAILAAVAIPRFADTTTSAELSVLRNLRSQLVSSAAMFTARQGTSPLTFGQYVVTTQTIAPGSNATLTTFGIDNRNTAAAGDGCQVAGLQINCTLTRWTATYNLDAQGGLVTATINPVAPNTQAQVQL
jgi:type IV pilus assembly protein PilA